MIPEFFKENTQLNIKVFGFDVKVGYEYYWPIKKEDAKKDPLVIHIEFRSDSKVISETGYRSHFLFSESLKYCEHKSIEDLVRALGEHLALENGYEPPEPQIQLSLF